MQLNQLKSTSPRKTPRRIGRGGKRGKMSGRGHKGQTARSGNSTRPEMREQIKKIPKLRGHGVNRAAAVNAERVLPVVVNLAVLESTFDAGTAINPKSLMAAGVVAGKGKRAPLVKILGTGEVTKKFTVTGCTVSASAKAKLEKSGGSVS